MQTNQGRTLESLRAVQAFLTTHAVRLAAVVNSGQCRKLDAIVADIDGHVRAQSGNDLAAQSATQRHRSLREVLIRDHMAPIAKIAAAELSNSPELQPFRIPRGQPSAERLRALALGMAEAARPFSEVFTSSGLPDDFIAQCVAAADAMVAAIGARKGNRVARGEATAGLKANLSQGRKTVHALDALVKKALQGDRPLLAAWNIAKRVERVATAPGTTPAVDLGDLEVADTDHVIVDRMPARAALTGGLDSSARMSVLRRWTTRAATRSPSGLRAFSMNEDIQERPSSNEVGPAPWQGCSISCSVSEAVPDGPQEPSNGVLPRRRPSAVARNVELRRGLKSDAVRQFATRVPGPGLPSPEARQS